MGNFVLAQAVPAASYQLLVFAWQLLHLFPCLRHETRLLGGKHTTPLQDEKARVEESRNTSKSTHPTSPSAHLQHTRHAEQHIHQRGTYSPARGTQMNCTCHSPLSSSSGAGLSVWGWVCACVRAGSSLASNSAALVVSFPGPRCSQADKLCHAFICHTGCYLSLPFTLASWYALSPAPGILSVSLKEKKRDLSPSAVEKLPHARAPPAGEATTKACREEANARGVICTRPKQHLVACRCAS